MKQQERLTSCAIKKAGSVPKIDTNGNTYGWEYVSVNTGKFKAVVTNPSAEEKNAITLTVTPGHKFGIQKAIETLAQIKPIGKSGIKQETVISFLVFDLVEIGVSEYVVLELCKECRQEPESQFFPDSGVFLQRAKNKMQEYKTIYNSAFDISQPEEPKPESSKSLQQKAVERDSMPWDDVTWENMTDEVKSELWKFCQSLPSPAIAEIYCNSYGFDYDKLSEEIS